MVTRAEILRALEFLASHDGARRGELPFADPHDVARELTRTVPQLARADVLRLWLTAAGWQQLRDPGLREAVRRLGEAIMAHDGVTVEQQALSAQAALDERWIAHAWSVASPIFTASSGLDSGRGTAALNVEHAGDPLWWARLLDELDNPRRFYLGHEWSAVRERQRTLTPAERLRDFLTEANGESRHEQSEADEQTLESALPPPRGAAAAIFRSACSSVDYATGKHRDVLDRVAAKYPDRIQRAGTDGDWAALLDGKDRTKVFKTVVGELRKALRGRVPG